VLIQIQIQAKKQIGGKFANFLNVGCKRGILTLTPAVLASRSKTL
jgi:hypothetical protein